VNHYKLIAAVAVGALLAGCSANGTASPPASVVTNPNNTSVMQFAVGTANMGQTGTVGLNTVSTFRQANGFSAALVNTPTITAPAGFVPPACGAGCVDNAASHQMSGAPQNVNPNVANPVTTFGQTGGVFSFGLAPENESTTGAAVYTRYANPIGGASTINYGGGPPAYPFFKDGTFPSTFTGYSQGFTMFAAAPVAGVYTLTDTVATGNAGTFTFSATSTLANLTPLPAITTPTFVKDGTGGGSGVVTVPVDARVVETMVYFQNTTQGTFFAVGPIRGTGPQNYTLPDFLGPCGGAAGTGCQNNAATRSLTLRVGAGGPGTGDSFIVYAATYDYPMFEGSPPGNVQQAPVINGGAATSNQADITTSPASASAKY
jgi:outer membrane murein-binding lipoprotein Lpp